MKRMNEEARERKKEISVQKIVTYICILQCKEYDAKRKPPQPLISMKCLASGLKII